MNGCSAKTHIYNETGLTCFIKVDPNHGNIHFSCSTGKCSCSDHYCSLKDISSLAVQYTSIHARIDGEVTYSTGTKSCTAKYTMSSEKANFPGFCVHPPDGNPFVSVAENIKATRNIYQGISAYNNVDVRNFQGLYFNNPKHGGVKLTESIASC